MKQRMQKKELINGYTERGVDWCAKQLYLTRKRLQESENIRRKLSRDSRMEIMEHECLVESHENLLKVLRERGIQPKSYRVSWEELDCPLEYDDAGNPICPMYTTEELIDGENLYCHESCELYRKYHRINTFAFYTFSLSDGELEAITSNLEAVAINGLVRLEDMETGEVIIKRREVV